MPVAALLQRGRQRLQFLCGDVTNNAAWTNVSTTVTNPERIIRWNYADSNVTPFAYVQMVLKGNSTVDYEAVDYLPR